MMDGIPEGLGLRHVLEGLIPSGPMFPRRAPALAASLARIVGEPLDIDVAELPKLDAYVMRAHRERGIGAFGGFLHPGFIEPLFAFVGEAIIRAAGGEWRMRYSEQFDLWEPWVVRRAEDRLVVYELAQLVKLFVCPEPESFSIDDKVYCMLKWPERLPLDQFA